MNLPRIDDFFLKPTKGSLHLPFAAIFTPVLSFVCAGTFNMPGFTAPENPKPSASLSLGFKALNEGDGQKALELFNGAAREHPDSAVAHHGRARALAQLGRKDEAVKEFKLSIMLNPADDIAKKSKDALKNLGEPVQEQGSVPSSFPSQQPVQSCPETVRSADVEKSISKILKQSEDRIKDIHTSSESYASSIYGEKTSTQNRKMEQATQELNDMKRFRVGRRGRASFQFDLMQRQAELQRNNAAILNGAKADYDVRKYEAQTRAMGVKSSVEGLQSQMLNKPSESSGIFLSPVGTNLYVRNYGHFDPVLPEAPEPLHAVPLKLPQVLKMQEESRKGHHSSSQNTLPAKSRTESTAPVSSLLNAASISTTSSMEPLNSSSSAKPEPSISKQAEPPAVNSPAFSNEAEPVFSAADNVNQSSQNSSASSKPESDYAKSDLHTTDSVNHSKSSFSRADLPPELVPEIPDSPNRSDSATPISGK